MALGGVALALGAMWVLVRADISAALRTVQWAAAVATLPLFAIGVAALFRVHRRAILPTQRAARGLCPGCGYDLRGNPGADRCSECGAATPRRDADHD